MDFGRLLHRSSSRTRPSSSRGFWEGLRAPSRQRLRLELNGFRLIRRLVNRRCVGCASISGPSLFWSQYLLGVVTGFLNPPSHLFSALHRLFQLGYTYSPRINPCAIEIYRMAEPIVYGECTSQSIRFLQMASTKAVDSDAS